MIWMLIGNPVQDSNPYNSFLIRSSEVSSPD